ncbi:MDR family MFS transporter [Herbaspirillum sp. GCM10030257]|uniref:MDR family MFS transporter n=1 Tax=Herbaspirillum sp. GCM10030257 TaxID=3273393 RepID=UPI0036161049
MSDTGTQEGGRYIFTEDEIRSVLLGLMLTMALAALDQTIISVALPTLATDLQGLDLMAWVVSAYLISAAVVTPVFGKLSDLYGRRITLLSAICLFMLGAACAAISQSMWQLVIARVVQGLGSGGLIAVSQAAIADVVSPRERGRYQVYFSTVHLVSNAVGPLLGGLLTQYLSWRWIFGFNLVLGALAFFACGKVLTRLPVPRLKRPIDYPGALLLSAGLTLLLLGLTQIGKAAWPPGPVTAFLFIGAAILLACFLVHESYATEPILPLQLFRLPAVSISYAMLFIAYMQLVALSVLIPMRAQTVLGLSTSAAALYLMSMTLSGPVGAFLAGKLMAHTGRAKWCQVAGAAFVATGLSGLGLMDEHPPRLTFALLMLIGAGVGWQLPTSLVMIQNAVPAGHVGVATATAAFFRSLGAAIGTAVLAALLVSLLEEKVSSALRATAGNNVMSLLIDGSVKALRQAEQEQLLKAASEAFRDLFLISGAFAFVGLCLSLCLPDTKLSGKDPGSQA